MQRTHSRRWPVALRHNGRDFLTTAQVARVLGIKTQSVYAYASRGHLTSERIAGIRGSVFALAEVEAFRRRTERRPPAGVVERIHTEITLLEHDRLYYRGTAATELARTTDFVDVVEMLWGTSVSSDREVSGPGLIPPHLPVAGRRVDTIRVVIDLLAAADGDRGDLETAAVARTAMRVIDAAVDGLPTVGPPARGARIADRLWPRLSPMAPTPRRIALLNSALVLLADHDLSAGAVAARVAASSRGSIYAVISAGLGAFDGPLHGGATTLAHEFLREVLSNPDDRTAVVARHLAAHGRVPGCGHIVYRDRDPRAEFLLEALSADGGAKQVAVVRDVAAQVGELATSDLALAAVALRYRMVPDAAETVFAIARIAGWVAHAIEEYREPRLRFRPEGVYTGVRPARAVNR